jgi:hypothetical protein
MRVTNSTLPAFIVALDDDEQFDYQHPTTSRTLFVSSLVVKGSSIEARGRYRKVDGAVGKSAGVEYMSADGLPDGIRQRVQSASARLAAALDGVDLANV